VLATRQGRRSGAVQLSRKAWPLAGVDMCA
jgi:hypothetical protein